jgi:hypothetical protein
LLDGEVDFFDVSCATLGATPCTNKNAKAKVAPMRGIDAIFISQLLSSSMLVLMAV